MSVSAALLRTRVHELAGFGRFVALRFQEDRCFQVAGSLTYTTLLSLVPFVTIAVTFIVAFPVFAGFMTAVKVFLLTNMVPEAAGRIITGYMQQFADNAASLTALGIGMLALTAISLMLTMESAFNDIWRVNQPRPLLQRFMTYWAVLTLGPVLLGVSLTITSYMVSFSLGLVHTGPGVDDLVLRVVPIVLTTIAFALLYLTVPNRFVPKSHALVGGMVAALAFEVMKRLFADYVAHVPTYTIVYGAFATFPIFLLWLYCSWLVILLGAVITASLSHWQGGAWRQEGTPEQHLTDALRILRQLFLAHTRDGAPVKLGALRAAVPIGLDQLEETLERLCQAHIVQRVPGQGYVLSRSPTEVRVADIYRLFVLQSDAAPTEGAPGDEEIAPILARINENLESNLRLSLQSVFGPGARA